MSEPPGSLLAVTVGIAEGEDASRTTGTGRSVAGRRLVDFPDLLAQFSRELNKDVLPEDVAAGSHVKVWWACSGGPDHVWQATVASRTAAGTNCPFCAGTLPSVTNTLVALYPDLAAQLHPSLNDSIDVSSVRARADTKLWWVCPVAVDHVWEARVGSRVRDGVGCPACVGRQVSVTNSLATVSPQLALEFDLDLNYPLTPETVVAGTQRGSWWRCRKESSHVWIANTSNRVRLGRGCPHCAGKRVPMRTSVASEPAGAADRPRLTYPDSLAVIVPDLVLLLHPQKNGSLDPHVLPASEDGAVWWRCASFEDHEWYASPARQVRDAKAGRSRPPACHICRGISAAPSLNLATKYPELAKQCHDSRNEEVAASDFGFCDPRLVWWRCPQGPDHEWKASVTSRVDDPQCPFCQGYRFAYSNSLEVRRPEIADQLHPTKNSNLQASEVSYGSGAKLWWRCTDDPEHEWLAAVNSRISSGCPHCVGLPRSAQEVLLSFEMASFLRVDHGNNRVMVQGKVHHVDVVDHQHRVIVEFDGSYWHRHEQKADTKKSETLRSAGWHVIRVREAPLKKLSPFDVQVPLNAPATDIARVVANELLSHFDLPAYDPSQAPQRAVRAMAFLDRLRNGHALRTALARVPSDGVGQPALLSATARYVLDRCNHYEGERGACDNCRRAASLLSELSEEALLAVAAAEEVHGEARDPA